MNRFEGFAYANESIAYRWGHSSRLAAGDVPPILPQGFTILAVQQRLVRLIEAIEPLSASSLRSSLQWFSWGTFAVMIALFLGTLVAAGRRIRSGVDHIFLAFLPWIVAVYGAGTCGVYYCLLPDYYHLDAILACVVAVLAHPFVRVLTDPDEAPPSLGHVTLLGVALGMGVANKVTWGVPCIVLFGLVSLAGPKRPTLILLRGALLAGSAVIAAGLILLACYQFEPARLMRGLQEWVAFMQNQQGTFALWGADFYTVVKSYNFDWLFPLEFAALLAGLVACRGWRSRVFIVVGTAGFLVLLWMASVRPARTTFWDINVLACLLAVLGVSAINRQSVRRGILVAWVVALVALNVRHPVTEGIPTIAASGRASDNRFAVFDEINRFAGQRPQLIMLVNNEYAHGGVQELLLKSSADFPTWNVTVGRSWLTHFSPNITFLHEYGPPIELPGDVSGMCLIWFNRPDLPSLESRNDQLAGLIKDPKYERITLPIYLMNLEEPPRIQVWVQVLRLKTEGAPYQSSFVPNPLTLGPGYSAPSLPGPEMLTDVTPLSARRAQATVIELSWPTEVGTGEYEIQMAVGDAEFKTIGRGAAKPGNYIVGDVARESTYRFRARWSVGRQIHGWSAIVVVPPL